MAYTTKIFESRVPPAVDRDTLEKNRINDRIGFETRFQTAGGLIFKPDPKSNLYISDQQRFSKDHNEHDKVKRQEERVVKETFWDLRKDKRLDKEVKRWQREDKKEDYQEQKRMYHQKVLLDNKRNTNGMPFNPITLEYAKDDEGRKLKLQDDEKKVRTFVRAQNIVERNSPYDLITGEAKKGVEVFVPKEFRERFDTKIALKREREAIRYEPIRDKYDYLDD